MKGNINIYKSEKKYIEILNNYGFLLEELLKL